MNPLLIQGQLQGPFSRRTVGQLSAALILFAYQQAHALSVAEISSAQANSSIKSLLEQGALKAVLQLGRTDGFLGNEQVRIGLPGHLEEASKLLRQLGQGRKLDELVTAMNRGAEQAVPFAKNLLVGAARSMNAVDAKNILTGGNTSVTDFFAGKTREPLTRQFLPIVTRATAKAQLADKYNHFAGKAQRWGLVQEEDGTIQNYVTRKTLDGLYLVIGQQEQLLRANPAKASSDLLRKVLGSLR